MTARGLRPWLLLALLPACNAVAGWDPDKILQVTAAQLPAAVGQPIATLRVGVLRNGVLQPVPFQVDEYNTTGQVWFASTGLPLKGKEGVFDGDDRLLVVAGDLGTESLPAGTPAPPGWLGELAASAQDETRYLQVLSGGLALATRSYMRHDVATGETETPFYTLRVDPANELNWKHLMVRSWRGPRDTSLVDTLKMRISGGVFTAATRLTLDNDNLRPRLIGQRTGPIRSTIQLETSVVFGGIPVMKMQVQVLRYPRHFEALTHARIPRLYRKALVNPEVRVTLDANNLSGSVVRTARGGTLQGITDGRIDATEQQLLARGLSSDEDWILFDARNGFSVLTFLDVPRELRGIPLEFVYEDSLDHKDKPERVLGQQPNIGYGIRGFPPGEDFRFGVTLAFDKELAGAEPRAYVRRWREAPAYRFRAAP